MFGLSLLQTLILSHVAAVIAGFMAFLLIDWGLDVRAERKIQAEVQAELDADRILSWDDPETDILNTGYHDTESFARIPTSPAPVTTVVAIPSSPTQIKTMAQYQNFPWSQWLTQNTVPWEDRYADGEYMPQRSTWQDHQVLVRSLQTPTMEMASLVSSVKAKELVLDEVGQQY